jgi:hypothetical protein
MANADTPRGLVPIRHRSGAPYNGEANPYHIPSGYATALFVGDPVIKVIGGSNTAEIEAPGLGSFPIGTLPDVNLAPVTDDTKITGVIIGFGANPNDLEKTYSPASTQAVAWVCDDPSVIYEIQADGIVTTTMIGLNAQMIATHAGDTNTGRSGRELDISGDPPAADASNQLLLLRHVNRADNDTELTHPKVEVMINQHTENQGTVGALGI